MVRSRVCSPSLRTTAAETMVLMRPAWVGSWALWARSSTYWLIMTLGLRMAVGPMASCALWSTLCTSALAHELLCMSPATIDVSGMQPPLMHPAEVRMNLGAAWTIKPR